jgi:DNA-binding HxlR family transcriptional regulator
MKRINLDTQRSVCPIASALDVFGDKWTLLVLRDLACGKSKFKDLANSPERIASNILTARLNRLVELGFIERVRLEPQSQRDGYRLSERGRALEPVFQAIAEWALSSIQNTKAVLQPNFS